MSAQTCTIYNKKWIPPNNYTEESEVPGGIRYYAWQPMRKVNMNIIDGDLSFGNDQGAKPQVWAAYMPNQRNTGNLYGKNEKVFFFVCKNFGGGDLETSSNDVTDQMLGSNFLGGRLTNIFETSNDACFISGGSSESTKNWYRNLVPNRNNLQFFVMRIVDNTQRQNPGFGVIWNKSNSGPVFTTTQEQLDLRIRCDSNPNCLGIYPDNLNITQHLVYDKNLEDRPEDDWFEHVYPLFNSSFKKIHTSYMNEAWPFSIDVNSPNQGEFEPDPEWCPSGLGLGMPVAARYVSNNRGLTRCYYEPWRIDANWLYSAGATGTVPNTTWNSDATYGDTNKMLQAKYLWCCYNWGDMKVSAETSTNLNPWASTACCSVVETEMTNRSMPVGCNTERCLQGIRAPDYYSMTFPGATSCPATSRRGGSASKNNTDRTLSIALVIAFAIIMLAYTKGWFH